MVFISSLVALVLTLGWGIGVVLQRDTWFWRWLARLQAWRIVAASPLLSLVLAVIFPAFILGLVVYWVAVFLSHNWLFFIYVPLLLYCFGRGNLVVEVNHYLTLARRGDTVAASQWVDQLRGGIEDDDNREVEAWPQLHAQALTIIAYRSFERLFAVLFWFFVLGAAGALVYRLSVIYCERTAGLHAGSNIARRWLWLLEWPAARALSLTWALVGNFDSCYSVIKNDLFNVARSTLTLLGRSLRGALGIPPALDVSDLPVEATLEQGDALLEADALNAISVSLSLFRRSLLLWVCVMALITITL